MSEERVTLRFDSFRSFLDECAERISEEGIFLATEAIQPVGSTVAFDLGLDADFPILRGTGEVLWVVEPNGGGSAPGMAVRYRSTDDATTTLVRRIVERQRAAAGAVFDLAPPAAGAPEAAEEPSSYATQTLSTVPEEEAVAAPEAADEAAPSEPVLSEPEAVAADSPPARPSYLEGVAAAKEETRGRGGLWIALAAIALVGGLAFWQRDFLAEKLGGGTAAAPPPVREIVEAPVVEPEVTEPEVQSVVEPEELALDEPGGVAPAPAPAATPLSRIERVQWRATDDGTVLRLLADGQFPEGSLSIERLVDPPRLVLRIAGVTAPLDSPTLAVGSGEVVGIRSALHGSAPSTSLHVVVDLADPTAQVAGTETGDGMLQVLIASEAISP